MRIALGVLAPGTSVAMMASGCSEMTREDCRDLGAPRPRLRREERGARMVT